MCVCASRWHPLSLRPDAAAAHLQFFCPIWSRPTLYCSTPCRPQYRVSAVYCTCIILCWKDGHTISVNVTLTVFFFVTGCQGIIICRVLHILENVIRIHNLYSCSAYIQSLIFLIIIIMSHVYSIDSRIVQEKIMCVHVHYQTIALNQSSNLVQCEWLL